MLTTSSPTIRDHSELNLFFAGAPERGWEQAQLFSQVQSDYLKWMGGGGSWLPHFLLLANANGERSEQFRLSTEYVPG